MSLKTATINARGAALSLRALGSSMSDALENRYNDLLDDENTEAETLNNIGLAIGNCDYVMKEIRKQRRKLVRARYELRKEHENEKND